MIEIQRRAGFLFFFMGIIRRREPPPLQFRQKGRCGLAAAQMSLRRFHGRRVSLNAFLEVPIS
ncbi:unnamed protein product [Victoria cruziana]